MLSAHARGPLSAISQFTNPSHLISSNLAIEIRLVPLKYHIQVHNLQISTKLKTFSYSRRRRRRHALRPSRFLFLTLLMRYVVIRSPFLLLPWPGFGTRRHLCTLTRFELGISCPSGTSEIECGYLGGLCYRRVECRVIVDFFGLGPQA